MEKILVSVCVPVYGVERFIENCLRSLFTQTWADRCEFIIVNDATKDSSIKIAKSVIEEFPLLKNRIHIINHKVNMGLAAARNTALEKAKGKYILCVDSDDWAEKDYVEKLARCAEENNADLTGCDFYREDYLQRRNPTLRRVKLSENKKKTLTKIIQDASPSYLWIKLFRREIFEKNSLRWITGIDAFEDFAILSRFTFFAEKIAYVNEPLYHYRGNIPGSIIHRNTKQKFQQMITALTYVDDFFDEQGVDNYYHEIIQTRILGLRIAKIEAKGTPKEKKVKIEKKQIENKKVKTKTSVKDGKKKSSVTKADSDETRISSRKKSAEKLPPKKYGEQNFIFDKVNVGVCYYPEQWDSSMWHSDLQRMKEIGIRTIRVGEFAWNKFEVEEGSFDYSFFDTFFNVCEKENMKVIYGTPTATPPAWLTEKYPEVLNARQDGVLYRHGMRRHYNYNSKKYIELCKKFITKFMQRYGSRKCIIGYQIDNELNCETGEFYSAADNVAFRKFLIKKYTTIGALNKAWGTGFWNQSYTDFEEVFVPRTTVGNTCNPHQMLDYYRFVSDSTIRFCSMQAEIIRKYKKSGDFITTNGMYGNIDNHLMAQSALDIYTYDSYPNFPFGLAADPLHSKDLNDRSCGRNLTEVRSICPHFGIMEQQSGAHGWTTKMEAPAPKPGQIMLWATQSVAHGADFVSFFRWRTASYGTEMYWKGILDWDNKDNRKLLEVADFCERVSKISGMAGADFEAQVAYVKDYDNVFDSQCDKFHNRIHWHSEQEFYTACQLSHTPVDYVYLQPNITLKDLCKYKVLFMPHSVILKEQNALLLKDYVLSGGTLIIGAMTGAKNENGIAYLKSQPGFLSDLTKTVVEESTLVGPADGVVTFSMKGKKYDAGIYNDILSVQNNAGKNTTVLASYSSNYYKGKPALVQTKAGSGKVLHFGGTFCRETVKMLLEYCGVMNPYSELFEIPECVEIICRVKDGKKYFFLLNYANKKVEITVKNKMTDSDSGTELSGKLSLKPYESKIFITQV